jgi:hypothetical protein
MHGTEQGLASGSALLVLGFVPHACFLVLDFQQFPPGPWFTLEVAGPVLILQLWVPRPMPQVSTVSVIFSAAVSSFCLNQVLL